MTYPDPKNRDGEKENNDRWNKKENIAVRYRDLENFKHLNPCKKLRYLLVCVKKGTKMDAFTNASINKFT